MYVLVMRLTQINNYYLMYMYLLQDGFDEFITFLCSTTLVFALEYVFESSIGDVHVLCFSFIC